MTKKTNSELIIKTKIWEKETFELIDYLNDDTINTKFKIHSSGVLCRDNKNISFNIGENLQQTPFDLLKIKKNEETGKYIINCGVWSKDLSQLIEEQGAFLVYRGLTIKELNKNYNYRYYKLSQGDIFKIGRIYFKVLDIHLNREGSDLKSNTVKGTMIRSSSCNSIILNGQQVIKGTFSPNEMKKQISQLFYSKNEKMSNNNSLLTIKNGINQKNESLDFFFQKKNCFLPRINSSNDLISVKRKESKKNNNKKKDKNKNNSKAKKDELVLKKPKKTVVKNKPTCRICYGEESNEDNPLICPCICKGSMKYIHYDCLKNWLNSKIEEEMLMDHDDKDVDVITYNRKDISCELCKEKLPDYVKHNELFYNISFYKPQFEEFIVLESMAVEKEKVKYIHLISFDNKFSINIGRANECDLAIAELSVSRYHCMLHKEDGELFLEDNSSKFGTLVLIQNNNMIMNDLVPLRVQINRTYIKLKVQKNFSFDCCGCSNILESQKYDYQVQNRKCFDILSYFIIKEDEYPDDENEGGDEQIEDNKSNTNNDNNSKQLIDDNYNKSKNNNEEDDKIILKENEKNESDINNNNNEIYNYMHINKHSTRFKKLNIKKGKNDQFELPKLDKINIDNFKDSISLISDRNKPSKALYNLQQKKQQINLIRINNNRDLNFDKTNSHSQSNINNNIINNVNPPSSKVIKDYYNHKNKKKK